MLASTYMDIKNHHPDDHSLNTYCCENLMYYMTFNVTSRGPHREVCMALMAGMQIYSRYHSTEYAMSRDYIT